MWEKIFGAKNSAKYLREKWRAIIGANWARGDWRGGPRMARGPKKPCVESARKLCRSEKMFYGQEFFGPKNTISAITQDVVHLFFFLLRQHF